MLALKDAIMYIVLKGVRMADRFEVSVQDKTYGVDVFPAQGNSRRFTVGSIPLSCIVSRSGKPECADLHFSVQADARVQIPGQELYTPSEFEGVLKDDSMPSHASFVIAQWASQSAKAAHA